MKKLIFLGLMIMAFAGSWGQTKINSFPETGNVLIRQKGTDARTYDVMNSNGLIVSRLEATSGKTGQLWLKDTNGSVRVYLRSNSNPSYIMGDLGIGTNSPEKKLHIQGTPWTGIKIKDVTKVGGRGIENHYLDGNNDGWTMYFAGHSTGQPLCFRSVNKGSAGAETLALTDRGNVGIGNVAPQAKLHVSGDILADEIRVEDIAANSLNLAGDLAANSITVQANGNTADFVFEDAYQLKDLGEVEAFIRANKHLPDVPSAAQMEEQGVNLAEMNKLLLQKVEELTLYSIELQKALSKERHARGTMEEKSADLEERLLKLEELLLNDNR